MNEHRDHSKKMKKKKVSFFLSGVIICLLFGIGIFIYIHKQFSPCAQFVREHSEYTNLRRFNAKDLSVYDGVQDEKTYIGYHCVIYDVTEGKNEFYAEGKGYHYLVGRDATKQLELFGGDIIESKYPKVGILKE